MQKCDTPYQCRGCGGSSLHGSTRAWCAGLLAVTP